MLGLLLSCADFAFAIVVLMWSVDSSNPSFMVFVGIMMALLSVFGILYYLPAKENDEDVR